MQTLQEKIKHCPWFVYDEERRIVSITQFLPMKEVVYCLEYIKTDVGYRREVTFLENGSKRPRFLENIYYPEQHLVDKTVAGEKVLDLFELDSFEQIYNLFERKKYLARHIFPQAFTVTANFI